MKRLYLVFVVLVITSLLAGCAPAAPEDNKVKLALIPVLDVIPIFIAEQNGYFAEQGIQVEQVPVKSAQERDVLIQTNQVDAVLTDLVSTALLNKDAIRVKAIYTARRPYPEAPLFRLLAAPNANIQRAADLKGVPVAISQNTVIQYLTERMLAAEGLAANEIAVQEVSAITTRFELLMNGNLKAATLPDPLAQGALAGGARLVVEDSKYPQYSQSVLSFRTDTLKAKPGTVRKFLVAWERAIKELNANPDKYRSVLIEQGRVPKSIENSYKMPPFPERTLPSQAEVADVIRWMRERGLLSRELSYNEMVDGAFVPK